MPNKKIKQIISIISLLKILKKGYNPRFCHARTVSVCVCVCLSRGDYYFTNKLYPLRTGTLYVMIQVMIHGVCCWCYCTILPSRPSTSALVTPRRRRYVRNNSRMLPSSAGRSMRNAPKSTN